MSRTRGLDGLQRRLRRYPDLLMRVAARELYQEAEETMTDSKEDTPVDTGALRASGFVEQPDVRRDRVTVTLGFGGVAGSGNLGTTNREDVGYAVYVHEDCNAHHEVGRCKYLERHVRRAERRLPRRLVRALRRETRLRMRAR